MRAIYKNVLIMASAVTLASMGTFASAKCAVDFKGTWQTYGMMPSGDGSFFACTFNADRDGELDPATSYCNAYNANGDDSFGAAFAGTGAFVTDDNCEVTGALHIGTAATITILNARMNVAGNQVSGIETINYPIPGNIAFTMFRIQ